MQQQGEYTINGSVDNIWQALNDPDALKASIPGCQSIEQVDAENLKATVRAKVMGQSQRLMGLRRERYMPVSFCLLTSIL